MAKIVLGHHAVAEEFLFAADRQRAGIGNPVAADEARRLEHVVHAENVELEGDLRRVLAADPIGEVDDPLGLRRGHRRHDVIELPDIAAHHLHLLAKMAEIGGLRVDIHADDLFATLRQERNEPSPDEPSATGDEGRHGCPSRMAFMNRAEDQARGRLSMGGRCARVLILQPVVVTIGTRPLPSGRVPRLAPRSACPIRCHWASSLAAVDLVIAVTPGSVISRRPTFTRSPAPGRRLFLIMRKSRCAAGAE